jgi:hypothetical protein
LGTPRYPVASIVVLQPFAVLSFKRHQSIEPREAPPPTRRIPPKPNSVGALLVEPTESFICLFIGLNKSAQDLGIYNVGDIPKEYNPARKIFVLMTGGNLHWAKMKNNCDNKNLLTNTNKNYVN